MARKYANCQFCDESADVKWHCQSCDLNLCEICNTNIHTKSEKLSEHNVDLLKDGECILDLENRRKVDLKEIACSKHVDQKCVTYCLNCDKSLCSSCLIRPYQYEELRKVYEEKCFLLEDLKSKIDECYPFFEEKAADFRKRDDNEIKKHNEVKEKIFHRKNEVKDAVTKEALALVEVMEGIWDTENNPVKTERERLCQVEQDLKARKIILDEVTQTQEPALVFSSAENISRDIPEKSFLEVKPPELYYIEPIDVNMEKVLGSIIRKPKVDLIKMFNVDFPEISGLVSLNDDICVMFNKDSRRFKYFTISDLKFVTTKNDIVDVSRKDRYDTVKIFDMTNYKEEILVSDDTFQIRLLKNDGTFQNVSPSFTKDTLNFNSIHAANDNEIIVGFTCSSSSTGILELINFCHPSKSRKIRRVECESATDKTLLTLPIKVTTNTNGDIFVIDQLKPSGMRRIVVMGKWGQPKWTYSGHHSINQASEYEEYDFDFSPNDIVTTRSGLVLVVEKKTNAIHVLYKDGHFICNCISDSEIIAPVSICFNEKGHLLIGSLESEKAKLHMVEFIE